VSTIDSIDGFTNLMALQSRIRRACCFDYGDGWFINKRGEKWAVTYITSTLNKSGKLQYEPFPSNRTEEYLEANRYDTFEEAESALESYRQSKEKKA
jgi:hypothetical protein